MGWVVELKPSEFSNHVFHTPEELLNSRWLGHKGDSDRDFAIVMRKFFNHPYIQGLVKENNWVKIFECWSNDYRNRVGGDPQHFYGNYPGWTLKPLMAYLYLIGVDFWKYLPKTFNLRRFEWEGILFWIDDDKDKEEEK